MKRLRPDVDIVLDILKVVAAAQPENTFAQSILFQYQERGGLSKKQLQGLYAKALKISSIPANKLATLEAIIRQKHSKERSILPAATPLYEKDENISSMINAILAKYPQHKRVLFLRSKFDNNQPLTPAEMAELRRFTKL